MSLRGLRSRFWVSFEPLQRQIPRIETIQPTAEKRAACLHHELLTERGFSKHADLCMNLSSINTRSVPQFAFRKQRQRDANRQMPQAHPPQRGIVQTNGR